MTDDERHVVWAALMAMVEDVHAPQDNLTEEQWRVAERLLARLAQLGRVAAGGTS